MCVHEHLRGKSWNETFSFTICYVTFFCCGDKREEMQGFRESHVHHVDTLINEKKLIFMCFYCETKSAVLFCHKHYSLSGLYEQRADL